MTTVLNSFPPTPGAGTSCPGTPMSGISTVAIKDGHEGICHGHHHQGDPADRERLARLSVYDGNSSVAQSVEEDGEGYFERVSDWQDHGDAGTTDEPPEDQKGVSGGELTGESSGRSSGRSGTNNDSLEEYFRPPPATETSAAKPSMTQKLTEKLSPKAKLPMPPRRSPGSYSTQIPNPPCPTPATPLSIARNPLSQVASNHPGPNNNPNNSPKNNSDSSNGSFTTASGNGLLTPHTAPSPASTLTTNSVLEAKHRAKMLGPMTYDEGVVDTTSQNGPETKRSPSPPIVLQEGSQLSGERMELEERGERSRKERLEDIEERIVGGEHGAFRD